MRTDGEGRRARRREDGFTLVEMLVAMGIFSVVLAIFGAGVVSMTNATARVQATSDTTNEARRVFSQLDKQVRYASALNLPDRVGDKWYVEFLTDATGASSAGMKNPSICHQWRLDAGTDKLELRTWDAGTSTVSSWRSVASYVMNDPTTEPPFSVTLSGVDKTRQQLDVALHLQRGKAPEMRLTSQFVARNTDTNTITNLDVNSDGQTERICMEAGRP